jgi:flagellar biosynthesis protein FliQ
VPRTDSITVILSFSCPVALKNANVFVSVVMLVGVSKIDELVVGLNFVPLLVVISVFSSFVLSVP